MGWAIGYNDKLNRDIGYGVPAVCDYPGCGESIDRGLSYLCGKSPYGDGGCGLYFCGRHLEYPDVDDDSIEDEDFFSVCERCANDLPPFEPTDDVDEWIEWKLTDESWAQWRDANPETVRKYRARLTSLFM